MSHVDDRLSFVVFVAFRVVRFDLRRGYLYLVESVMSNSFPNFLSFSPDKDLPSCHLASD